MLEPLSSDELDELQEYADLAASKSGVFLAGPHRAKRLIAMARKALPPIAHPRSVLPDHPDLPSAMNSWWYRIENKEWKEWIKPSWWGGRSISRREVVETSVTKFWHKMPDKPTLILVQVWHQAVLSKHHVDVKARFEFHARRIKD